MAQESLKEMGKQTAHSQIPLSVHRCSFVPGLARLENVGDRSMSCVPCISGLLNPEPQNISDSTLIEDG